MPDGRCGEGWHGVDGDGVGGSRVGRWQWAHGSPQVLVLRVEGIEDAHPLLTGTGV